MCEPAAPRVPVHAWPTVPRASLEKLPSRCASLATVAPPTDRRPTMIATPAVVASKSKSAITLYFAFAAVVVTTTDAPVMSASVVVSVYRVVHAIS